MGEIGVLGRWRSGLLFLLVLFCAVPRASLAQTESLTPEQREIYAETYEGILAILDGGFGIDERPRGGLTALEQQGAGPGQMCVFACAGAYAFAAVHCHASVCLNCGNALVCGYASASAYAWSASFACAAACAPAAGPIFCINPIFPVNPILRAELPDAPAAVDAELNLRRHVPWNTFENIVNIFEVSNPSNDQAAVKITANGQTFEISLAPGQQQDVLADHVFALPKNAYGMAELASNALVHIRVLNYIPRPGGAFPEVTAATATEGNPPLRGVSYAAVNLAHPVVSAAKRVYAWASLINLDPDQVVEFNVDTLVNNEVVYSRIIEVSAGGRADIEAGHEHLPPGAQAVIRATPNNDSPYMFFVNRYGVDTATGLHEFIINTIAKEGSNEPAYAAISKFRGRINWLEILNTAASTQTYAVNIFAGIRGKVAEYAVELGQLEQIHLPMHEYLQEGESGFAEIVPLTEEGVFIANSNTYSLLADGVGPTFSSPARGAATGALTTNLNLFLNFSARLAISNLDDQPASVELEIPGAEKRVINLAARETAALDLADTELFGTAKDSYALVTLRSSARILAELQRELADVFVVPLGAVALGGNANGIQPRLEDIVDPQVLTQLAEADAPAFAQEIEQYIADGKPLPELELLLGGEPMMGAAMLPEIREQFARVDCVFACAFAYAYATAYCKVTACASCGNGASLCASASARSTAVAFGAACAVACRVRINC